LFEEFRGVIVRIVEEKSGDLVPSSRVERETGHVMTLSLNLALNGECLCRDPMKMLPAA
jgi:hypothetical protein